MRITHLATLFTALLLALAAAPLAADEVLDAWRRDLDMRPMNIPERADWLERQVREKRDGADIAALQRFLINPARARNYAERTSAAMALARFGMRHLAPATESPIREIRRFTFVAAVARITESHLPLPLTEHVNPERFRAHGYSVVDSVEAFLEGLERDAPDTRAFCLAVLYVYRPQGDPTLWQLRTGQLLEGLKHGSPWVRCGAAAGLRGYVHPPLKEDATTALIRAAGDPDPRVRRTALETLGGPTYVRGSNVLPAIARGLADPCTAVVAAAAESLLEIHHRGQTAGDPIEPVLAALDRVRDPAARAVLIRAAVTFGADRSARLNADTLQRVCTALSHPSPIVRLAAARHAHRFQDSRIPMLAELLSHLRDPEPAVRAAVLISLRWIRLETPPPQIAMAALRAARDPSPWVRSCATDLIARYARWGRASIAELMRAPLRDSSWLVRGSASSSLWRMGAAARICLPELIAALGDDPIPWSTRRIILRLGTDAVPTIVDHLHRAGPRERADLADLLGEIGKPAHPALKELLGSDREELRAAALAGFARAGPMAMFAAEEELVRAAATEKGATGAMAGWTLYRIYRRGSPREALRDAAGRHRWCAWALAQMARESPSLFQRVADELVRLRRHRERAVGDAAADALAELGVLPPSETERFASGALPRVALTRYLKLAEAPRRRLAAARTLRARSVQSGRSVRDAVREAYGVKIDGPRPPGRWLQLPEVGGVAAPIDRRRALVPAERRILAAIAHYPPTLIRGRLKRVVLVATLTVGRAQYGGTYRGKTIYLATAPGSGLDLERMFHHELSSLLWDAAKFPRAAWEKTLPPGRSYGRGGRAAIRAGRTGGVSTGHLAAGFFKPYAAADLENDFNVFTEMVMTYPGWARAMAAYHPRLAAKWALWRDYLKSLDPHFEPPAPPN